jgi:hypothetical protein
VAAVSFFVERFEFGLHSWPVFSAPGVRVIGTAVAGRELKRDFTPLSLPVRKTSRNPSPPVGTGKKAKGTGLAVRFPALYVFSTTSVCPKGFEGVLTTFFLYTHA